jgi:AcrR family transcriptional regulator
MPTTTDGRATRWQAHNALRRRELVEATLRAIRTHGHTVGMDEVAAEAGTSRTVFYRHFGDRNGLYTAVVESVQQFIMGSLAALLDAGARLSPDQLVTELADAYLAWLEAHDLDPGPSATWGYGIVGFIWSVADRWILTDLRRPRAQIVSFVHQLFELAFATQTREYLDDDRSVPSDR